jgi:hypothetical protein
VREQSIIGKHMEISKPFRGLALPLLNKAPESCRSNLRPQINKLIQTNSSLYVAEIE